MEQWWISINPSGDQSGQHLDSRTTTVNPGSILYNWQKWFEGEGQNQTNELIKWHPSSKYLLQWHSSLFFSSLTLAILILQLFMCPSKTNKEQEPLSNKVPSSVLDTKHPSRLMEGHPLFKPRNVHQYSPFKPVPRLYTNLDTNLHFQLASFNIWNESHQ